MDPLEVGLDVVCLQAMNAFSHPIGLLPFRDRTGYKDFGWQLGAWAVYAYSGAHERDDMDYTYLMTTLQF